MLLSACAGGPREAAKTDAPYSGPPVTIESSGPQHRIILTAPSAGWTVALDTTARRLNHTDAFITVVRPNPAFNHAQALITQEVGTAISTTQPVEAYIRSLDFGEKAGDQPYHFAGRAPAK